METLEIPSQKSPFSAGESNSSGSQENKTKTRSKKIENKEGFHSYNIKGRKKSKRKTVSNRKNKPSPVFKLDEETITSTSDNTTNTLEELELSQTNSQTGSNSSSEDETLLTHRVLSHILNIKKLELMESEEVINALMNQI